jgi:hypothetical protein
VRGGIRRSSLRTDGGGSCDRKSGAAPGRPHPGVLAASSAAVALVAAPALARPAGGTVGDPQPELAQFRTGPAGGPGSAGMLANASIVLASLTPSGAAINACVVALGGRSCAHLVTLHAHPGDTFSPTPQVLVTGPTDFSIVASDCCHLANGVVVFSSTDGGATYLGPTQAGNIAGVTTGTVAGGQLVVADALTSTYRSRRSRRTRRARPRPPRRPIATSPATPRWLTTRTACCRCRTT